MSYKIQITVELVTTERKMVKGEYTVIAENMAFPSENDMERASRYSASEQAKFAMVKVYGYAPDVEKEVATLSKVYQQEIMTDEPEKVLQDIIKAANGI